MIVLDVRCGEGHRFEGWFADRATFEAQAQGGQIACPVCGNTGCEQAPTAARIGRKGSGAPSPAAMLAKIAALQAAMLPKSTYVGEQFAAKARAMAEGREPDAQIHGKATPDEARALRDDGVPVMPLLVPVVPPEEQN